jgi:hypothetical protein
MLEILRSNICVRIKYALVDVVDVAKGMCEETVCNFAK